MSPTNEKRDNKRQKRKTKLTTHDHTDKNNNKTSEHIAREVVRLCGSINAYQKNKQPKRKHICYNI